MKVKEVMTENPIVAELPGTRTEVLKKLVKNNVTGLPVVRGEDGTLAGFVTRQDIFAKPDEEQLALVMRRDAPTIGPNASVKDAARIMVDNSISHLPVVEKNKLVGILTPTDLLIVVEKDNPQIAVEEIVRSPCIPIYLAAPLSVALATFRAARVTALPVLDDDAKLVGILTDRDMFNQTIVDSSVVMSDLGISDDEDNWTWEGLRNVMKLWYEVSRVDLPKLTVKDIMIKNPMTVFRKTLVGDAARIMRKHDFGQLPVRDSKDNLVAMIYDIDVVSTLTK
ncbi:MAG: CBS domain-containing protein [Thermoplasmatota archaeon]|nr:CBS domain-containing protein [Candidatus Thermoplasmatota archaeon]MBU1913576.1 CBS domain-containing protein [Candidatus Thermoplasmatota archaeon]